MVLGNTLALVQNDLKRLLAYSSIAHAGYLLIGICVAFVDPAGVAGPYLGAQGVLFYLGMYSLMTLGAFGVILAVGSPKRPVEAVDDLAGLGRTHPMAALAMALCLFSLAGIPPLAGFWGKFSIFASALSVTGSDSMVRMFRLLAVIGVVNAAIGAYYYLRIVVVMYLRSPQGEPLSPRAGWPTVLAVGTCASLSLLLGLFPDPINRASREAAVHAMARPEPVLTPQEEAGRVLTDSAGAGDGSALAAAEAGR
jgi:NADH-quinone oxidoreductase subunit N